jgi:transcriptional regulator with XRE-family HTH domain
MRADEPDLADAGDLAAMGARLGRRLADLRRGNGLTQYQLAKLIGYARGTLSAVECGRYNEARRFWQQCDDVLHAQGQLVGRYDEIKAHVARTREKKASAARTVGHARLAEWRRTSQQDAGPEHRSPTLHPEVTSADVHIWFTMAEGVTCCLIIPRAQVSPKLLAETVRRALEMDRELPGLG